MKDDMFTTTLVLLKNGQYVKVYATRERKSGARVAVERGAYSVVDGKRLQLDAVQRVDVEAFEVLPAGALGASYKIVREESGSYTLK